MAAVSKLLNRNLCDCQISWIIRGTERRRVISGLGSVGRMVTGIIEKVNSVLAVSINSYVSLNYVHLITKSTAIL